MIIKYRYFGISPSLSREKHQIELPDDSSVENLIYSIRHKVGDPSKEVLQKATYLVNKVNATKETVLNDGDDVIIMYAIGGG